MCNKEKKEGKEMNEIIVKPNNISFSDFIKTNRKKINTITPKNPPISKNDEWRNEDFWDDLYKEKQDK